MAAPNLKGGIVEFFAPGDHLTMTAGGAISGGNIVRLSGNRTVVAATAADRPVGIALHDAASGEKVVVATEGVWPAKAAGAITAGDVVEVSATAGSVQADNASSTIYLMVGIALESIADLATGRVKLRL